jgi:hypothetical protein
MPTDADKRLTVGGFICAVFLPPLGAILGIVLLVRERVGRGIAVLLVALITSGRGVALYLTDESATSAAAQSTSFGANRTGRHRFDVPIDTGTGQYVMREVG